MYAETKKEVLVEYSIDTVYDCLIYIFPVKYYNLRYNYGIKHNIEVFDSFNSTFRMEISLKEKTPNTTIITFLADYPHAIMDLTHGGQQAIDTILEELLKELNKQPKTADNEVIDSDIEIVNAENFVNSTKNKKHTLTIVFGYILCLLSYVLPFIALINYDSGNAIMAMFFVIGILCLSIEISVSIILQYYEDKTPILHGRIQLCLCGLLLFIFGLVIHPGLAVAGILIPLIAIVYFVKREKSIE